MSDVPDTGRVPVVGRDPDEIQSDVARARAGQEDPLRSVVVAAALSGDTARKQDSSGLG